MTYTKEVLLDLGNHISAILLLHILEVGMKDEKLQGNEKIEKAVEGLKKEPTQEMLAHADSDPPPDERRRGTDRCRRARGGRFPA